MELYDLNTSQEACGLLRGTLGQPGLCSVPELPPSQGVGHVLSQLVKTQRAAGLQGPLMLEMGVLPDVAAATCATMILFTAASASVIYLTFGGLRWVLRPYLQLRRHVCAAIAT